MFNFLKILKYETASHKYYLKSLEEKVAWKEALYQNNLVRYLELLRTMRGAHKGIWRLQQKLKRLELDNKNLRDSISLCSGSCNSKNSLTPSE